MKNSSPAGSRLSAGRIWLAGRRLPMHVISSGKPLGEMEETWVVQFPFTMSSVFDLILKFYILSNKRIKQKQWRSGPLFPAVYKCYIIALLQFNS